MSARIWSCSKKFDWSDQYRTDILHCRDFKRLERKVMWRRIVAMMLAGTTLFGWLFCCCALNTVSAGDAIPHVRSCCSSGRTAEAGSAPSDATSESSCPNDTDGRDGRCPCQNGRFAVTRLESGLPIISVAAGKLGTMLSLQILCDSNFLNGIVSPACEIGRAHV